MCLWYVPGTMAITLHPPRRLTAGRAGLTRNDGPHRILLRPFGPGRPGHAVNFRGWPWGRCGQASSGPPRRRHGSFALSTGAGVRD
jgi:hypothetical protein